MRHILVFATLTFSALAVSAQWDIQDSGTKASLRGIHSLGKGIAWASGTGGTVLRTEDGGVTWQHCAVPPEAEELDFRGVQALDANTALVMSSGKGYVSRIYKTVDGCKTWKLVFTNPDEGGFFDSLRLTHDKTVQVLGDPVKNTFAMFLSDDAGDTWFASGTPGRDAPAGAGAFAASNSSLIYLDPFMYFGTGAGSSVAPQVYRTHAHCVAANCSVEWTATDVPLGITGSAAGVFSLAARSGDKGKDGLIKIIIVAVGGIYDRPAQSSGTAATSEDGGQTWKLASAFPGGYRSSVAYAPSTKTWVAVGTNGTDVSNDDGHNWRALKPGPNDAPDADKNWNALSLPFVVGPHGRIGVLRGSVVTAKP
jgi:photosystem II stability/assembly factor-like uncharacterized protein